MPDLLEFAFPNEGFEERLANIGHYGKEIRRQWEFHLLLVVSLIALTVPIVLVVILSTQTNNEIIDFTFIGIGSRGIKNYVEVITGWNFDTYLVNSFVMATAIAVGKIAISLFAALAIVFYDFPFKRGLFVLILLTLMLPVPVRIVPLFELMVNIGWHDSMLALIAPYFASPTAVLLLRQRFRSISDSLVDTAKLDGIGPLKFLIYVLIPMSKSMIIGLFVISFIWGWNQYLWPLVAIQTDDKQVVQVGLQQLQGATGAGEPLWGLMMAGVVLTLLPPLGILIVLHKPLLRTFHIQTK